MTEGMYHIYYLIRTCEHTLPCYKNIKKKQQNQRFPKFSFLNNVSNQIYYNSNNLIVCNNRLRQLTFLKDITTIYILV